MGSQNGMKESPSAIRRWFYRSRLTIVVQQNRKCLLLSSLFAALLLLLIFLYWGKSVEKPRMPADSGNATTGHVNFSAEDDVSDQQSQQEPGNQRLFYNRVPKCGSSTLVALLRKLAARNGFEHTSSPLLDDWAIFIKEKQTEFVKEFMSGPKRSSFERHLFFLDFTKFGMENPIYINMIRDPTERFISEFYFRRRLQNEGTKKGEKKWYDEDLENCVRTGKDYDCRLVEGTFIKNMIAFFCGHDIECSKHNSAHALARAKENVDKYFAVVGILEDLGMTLTVLEKKVPSYFAGALELHLSNSDNVVNKGKNRVDRVSEEVKKMIRANLTMEYEFYDFIKQRLIAQNMGEL